MSRDQLIAAFKDKTRRVMAPVIRRTVDLHRQGREFQIGTMGKGKAIVFNNGKPNRYITMSVA